MPTNDPDILEITVYTIKCCMCQVLAQEYGVPRLDAPESVKHLAKRAGWYNLAGHWYCPHCEPVPAQGCNTVADTR